MKYNHMFDVAFTVISEKKNWEDITFDDLMEGLIKRLPSLYEDGAEVFGYCDSFEIEVCDACRGKGYILSNDEDGNDEIQRCDTCKSLVSDDEAKMRYKNEVV